jgi:hypothetical protein
MEIITWLIDLILRMFDQGHRFGLMNNLANYCGLNIIKSELCELTSS